MPYFKVRDLMVNVIDSKLKKGSGALCMEVNPTVLTCGKLSPVMHCGPSSPIIDIAKISPRINWLREAAAAALKTGDEARLEALLESAQAVGAEMGLRGALGSGVGYPNPECGGSSEVPTPITPWVHVSDRLTFSDLAVIKKDLRAALEVVERLEEHASPKTDAEKKAVAAELEAMAQEIRGK